MIEITKIKDRDEFDDLLKVTKKEGSDVPLYPTHIVRQKGAIPIVGYVSIFNLPIVDMWLDKSSTTASDVLEAKEKSENICREMGLKTVIIRADKECQIAKHLESWGYSYIKSVDLYFKEL